MNTGKKQSRSSAANFGLLHLFFWFCLGFLLPCSLIETILCKKLNRQNREDST
jgi:hypothetical protein